MRSGRTFFVKSVIWGKLSKPDSQEHSCILSFRSKFWLNNWRSYGNLKIWPIFLPGDPVPWPNSLSMLLTGTADPFHMWTNFGDHMSKRSRVMLDKMDRLTDKQTNEHTCQKILASNKILRFCLLIIQNQTRFITMYLPMATMHFIDVNG